MRPLAVLDELADGGHARGPQQLTQLGQVVALGGDPDDVGALLGPARDQGLGVARVGCPSVEAAVHSVPSSVGGCASQASGERAGGGSGS